LREGIVGFYARVIFPRLCDFFLDQPEVARHRSQLLADVRGEILEIGFGTGLNLAHYPEHVRQITTVDPNPGMHQRALRRIQQTNIAVKQHLLRGESLPFEDNTFDCVVSTFTLCSIEDVPRALQEVYRVLKPGGRFLFLEHGRSPEPGVQKWQRRWNWLQRRLADGCRLDRDMRSLISAVPFSSLTMENYHLEKAPRTHGYLYQGMAIK
jgi:ubiquinone/menaquinone biosynthesis C-methylase UbiE